MQMSSAQLPKPMFPLQWSDVQSEQGGVRSEHFEFCVVWEGGGLAHAQGLHKGGEGGRVVLRASPPNAGKFPA